MRLLALVSPTHHSSAEGSVHRSLLVNLLNSYPFASNSRWEILACQGGGGGVIRPQT